MMDEWTATGEKIIPYSIRKNDYKAYYKISVLLKDLGKKDEAIQMLEHHVYYFLCFYINFHL